MKKSFEFKTKERVMAMLVELNEINHLPSHKITHYALDRKNYLEQKIKYYLVPVNQPSLNANLFSKQYVNYLTLNQDVAGFLIKRAGGNLKRLE
ncbi:MAG: hypothetical protein I3273_00065 [Candidatus Moeniiplasma glomeromycotorum]|nr:hypothetical protein [Candidatus Moeniiplasma glomeromycotorum]MCE8167475.1 hypothetical protein [Candidatus Moeniiplasma glomeromycotorum]MCE8168511.1 hypothetical protein [Candidatus Moeniiplasma glomeromycotorum]